MKFATILLCWASLLISFQARGTTLTYRLKALDGKAVIVQVNNPDTATEQKNKIIVITCKGHEIIALDNKYGHIACNILAEHFLEVTYNRTGGSDCGVRDILLICVDNNRPFVALNTAGYSDSNFGEIDQEYKVNTVISRDSDTWLCRLKVSHTNVGGRKTKPYREDKTLHFDQKRHIFYDTLVVVKGKYMVTDVGSNTKTYKQINGWYPYYSLNHGPNYCIDGIWYRNYWGIIWNEQFSKKKELYKSYHLGR